jgi:uncharacterized protein (DUF1501 family)
MALTRRDCLRAAALAGAASLIPVPLHAAGGAAGSPDWDRTLILIELDGGNDGLNTIVPHLDPTYTASRSGLRLTAPTQVRALTGANTARDAAGEPMALGFNWNLVDGPGPTGRLQGAWDDGELAIVLGVGMPDPNRSHFRGGDIWHTAPNSVAQVINDGWLRRTLPTGDPGGSAAAHGILLRRPTANPLAGSGQRVLSIDDPLEFIDGSLDLTDPDLTGITNPGMRHVLGQVHQVVAGADAARRCAHAGDQARPERLRHPFLPGQQARGPPGPARAWPGRPARSVAG